ncbi:MAG: hypothetical protein JSW38_01765 [Dehalococcoidia bacterium]|nr:MAG: hypothetical protein JSW38_01765 [Dehalococcoidia bacterium]
MRETRQTITTCCESAILTLLAIADKKQLEKRKFAMDIVGWKLLKDEAFL